MHALRKESLRIHQPETTTTMKIFFGFPNSGDITKLSPALQYRGINLLKAAPCQIQLKGLYKVNQPGYADYASNLPAFLYAFNLKKRVPLSREGYPITTSIANLVPISIPAVTVSFKGSKIPARILEFTTVKEIASKDKNTNTYVVEYKTGLVSALKSSGCEQGQFPIGNTVSSDDLGATITILRILSAFLHVHKYPAFKTLDDFEMELADRIESEKRDATEAEMNTFGEGIKKRVLEMPIDGETTAVIAERTMDDVRIKIYYAKPPAGDELAWGNTSDIPVTDGIVFPYVDELATWDKETVCNVIGKYFTRTLGHTTEGSLKGYSELCTSWKRSIHRSSVGNTLSHLFKVIDIAIPAQARVFPIFENGMYTGCYLSGAGFSVALRGDVLRPTDHVNNTEDFEHFEGTDAILRKITDLFGTTEKHAAQFKKAKTMGADKSCRGLHNYLKTWVIEPSKWEQIRIMAAKIRYPQEFLRINMENIQLVLTWVKGEPIPTEIPMHVSGLGRMTNLELALSAFGPSAPSPVIPGAPKLALTPKPPPKFSKPLVFRTTSLENAISDWREIGTKGFTYNGPTNLSGRYQHVAIKGEAERDRWFEVMNGYYTWCKAQAPGMSDVVGNTIDESEDFGGVLVDDGVDMSGF